MEMADIREQQTAIGCSTKREKIELRVSIALSAFRIRLKEYTDYKILFMTPWQPAAVTDQHRPDVSSSCHSIQKAQDPIQLTGYFSST